MMKVGRFQNKTFTIYSSANMMLNGRRQDDYIEIIVMMIHLLSQGR